MAVRRVCDRTIGRFGDLWYGPMHQRHAPLKYCDDWEREHLEYEPICWPLPLRINCLGCFGCSHNINPFLGQDKSKGPFKVATTPLFNEQYEGMFGKEALVELLWKLEKGNMKIDEDKKHSG